MSVQKIVNITTDLNNNDFVTLDIGGWDFIVVHLILSAGTFSFLTSNDSGDVTGVSDGSAASAANFIAVTGTLLSNASAVTTLAASGMVKFSGIGQYFRISGAEGAQITKGLVRLYKIC